MVVLDEALSSIARLGVLRLSRMSLPEDGGEALWLRLERAGEALHIRWQGTAIADIPGVQEARALYRAVGLDPTKTRPSSEALLRRAVKGKGLYRVHPLVDMFNLVSLTELLPVGLYDASKIVGDTTRVRLGLPGWGFDGIRKGRVNVAGRLCVADAEGPFGSPTSDSLRTSIEGDVPRVLAIFFQPAEGDIDRLRRALDTAAELGESVFSAVLEERRIIPE
jgi:DNA/RNA-binding domain of Phe-tRNA-synthetase-like protein